MDSASPLFQRMKRSNSICQPHRRCAHVGADENGICNFLAKVKHQSEKEVTVQDAAGEVGTISLGGEAADFRFDIDETYCFHHVSIKSGRMTLWSNGGVELVTATAFESVGASASA
eukprot:6455602-Amphidinium_carterae.2